MRSSWIIVAGVLVTIAGAVWALQGFGIIGGSFMSGDSVWAIIGPLVIVAGLAIAAVGARRLRSAR
ncbi:MAG: hypothetical protein ACLQI7_02035 [Streptosporangiaceae bacterium]|jgi:hypothetical protein